MLTDEYGGVAVEEAPETDEFGGVAFAEPETDEFGGTPVDIPYGTFDQSAYDERRKEIYATTPKPETALASTALGALGDYVVGPIASPSFQNSFKTRQSVSSLREPIKVFIGGWKTR
jgi:hypothetical protein